jgi:hypothetical protein
MGSSNLKYSTPYFSDQFFTYVDNSVPGWMPTPDNITALRNSVRAYEAEKVSAFVFDLFGNTSVRFEQFDGSTSLPFKSQGKFHLGGNVVVSPPETFKKTVASVIPVLLEKRTLRVSWFPQFRDICFRAAAVILRTAPTRIAPIIARP